MPKLCRDKSFKKVCDLTPIRNETKGLFEYRLFC